NRILKRERPSLITVDEGLKRFEAEIAFLIRSFFFVFLGLIATLPNPTGGATNWNAFVLYGVIISLSLLLVRYLAVTVATVKSEIRAERTIMWVVLARGLAAAVLSTFPSQEQYEQYFDTKFPGISSWYINIALVIILITAVICTLGIFLISRKRKEEIAL
ncbi:cation:proton antiporter, partial [Candidatus Bathyarchaeota archaeon]|nr:cation:proton antiporter [Candidatus Bathyarchaeota archaeon]